MAVLHLTERGVTANGTAVRAEPDRRPRRVFRATPAGVRAAREAVSMLTTMQKGLKPLMVRT
jgi:hypothetical protein